MKKPDGNVTGPLWQNMSGFSHSTKTHGEGEPPNKGHFGDDINSADLFFVERLRGSKCIVGIILGPQVMSFVERFVILCPYLGESTIRGLL